MRLLLQKNSLQEKMAQLGLLSVICLGISIPLSTSLTSIFTILTSLLWLVSGKFKETYASFMNNPVIRAALLLFILFIIGVTYSTAGFNEALHGLNTYRKLFLIVIFSSFVKTRQSQQWAIYAFFIGCFILLGTSCISDWKIIPTFTLPSNTLYSHVTHSIYMAFFAFWLAVKFMENSRLVRAAYGILFCLTTYNIFFVVNGRSGYVLFVFLMIFFLYHYFDKGKFIFSLLLVGLLLLSSLFFANKFSERLLATKQNFYSYQQKRNNHTSIGQRLDFAKTSLRLVMKHPLAGYGTGSFAREYKKLSQQIGTYATDNPHNEYLSITVQLGAIGLIMFLYLLTTQWWYSKNMKYESLLAQGFVLTIVTGALMNSMLLDAGEGHFFAYCSAILFANINTDNTDSSK